MGKYKWLLLLGGAVLILIGWGLFSSAPKVDTVTPKKQAVVDLIVASGTVRSARQSALGLEIYGQIREVRVREGDVVQAGQILLDVDARQARERLDQARWAAVTARREWQRLQGGPQKEEIRRARSEVDKAAAARLMAEQDLQRMQRLYQEQLIPKADLERSQALFDQAKAVEEGLRSNLELMLRQPIAEDLKILEARLKEKEAALKVAETELKKTVLTAPFPGLVLKRQVEPGQSIVPGTPLITLADLEQVEVVVETDENNLSKIRRDQEAVVIPPAFKDRPFRARLVRIGPEVDPTRGVIALRFRPLTLPEYIRPDMTVDVNIETGRYSSVWTIPVTALLEEKGKAFIYVLQNGRAVRREVRLLTKGPEWAALADLEATAQVILKGTEVQDGQRVRPRRR